MIPFAVQYNLRLVLLNFRDYPGSTPLSPDDLDNLRGPSVESRDARRNTVALKLPLSCAGT